jgi:hypothetical protein
MCLAVQGARLLKDSYKCCITLTAVQRRIGAHPCDCNLETALLKGQILASFKLRTIKEMENIK